MLYTLGHSNLPLERFLELLSTHNVEVVVDVRARPFSRRNPQYNHRPFAEALQEAGFGYVWMGDRLGGVPHGSRQKLNVEARLRDPEFREGLETLVELASRHAVALVCAEEDPRRCHRRFLVVRGLIEFSALEAEEVGHIRADGRLVTEAQLRAEEAPLFSGRLD
ncbi:hypothetical protein Ocepr_1786 [Oceanithermus profundus DSM 14977]|uniref:DUF488 domain-containing protein n=1 Tax=Oceanithermus profundus (strain DSM 14977 / NBRC 100410 / VKM B-2274 / 506) TaxID=670487 RepID=E4U9S5_OCEP5|nr:DUF488 domain-containing protein [Oceanithermus profundus]ADR37239.1 hypothetical protein Ocepr_1786 [Oceanithermus profundus DSM 14977]